MLLLPHLSVSYCLGSSPLTAQMEVRRPKGWDANQSFCSAVDSELCRALQLKGMTEYQTDSPDPAQSEVALLVSLWLSVVPLGPKTLQLSVNLPPNLSSCVTTGNLRTVQVWECLLSS